MLNASAAALCALLTGCASVSDETTTPHDPQSIFLQAGDKITVRSTDVEAHVCIDSSRLVCSYGSGRLSYVTCECQRATASPAVMR